MKAIQYRSYGDYSENRLVDLPSLRLGMARVMPLVRGPGFGLMADGTWREFIAAPAASRSLIPDSIDDDHAAAYLAGAGLSQAAETVRYLIEDRPFGRVLMDAQSQHWIGKELQ